MRALRDAENNAYEITSALHSESAEGVKAYMANLSRHYAALQSMEETGYERGMSDCGGQIERLRRILTRYGDRVPMATCHRSDWQQEIDDALNYVADNPEKL